MCGRYALDTPPAILASYFDLDEVVDYPPRYNIPPGTDVPVIRQSPENKWVLHQLRWGLVPHWAKDISIGHMLNNARGETVATKPSFREAFQRRRCLIPAIGYYEWETVGKVKTPHFISFKSGKPMALAGLWESWKKPDGEILRSCCIITTGPNAIMEPIHDRMPVIINPNAWEAWLEAPAGDIAHLVRPYDADEMQAWPVSRRVNKTVEDDARMIAPEAADES